MMMFRLMKICPTFQSGIFWLANWLDADPTLHTAPARRRRRRSPCPFSSFDSLTFIQPSHVLRLCVLAIWHEKQRGEIGAGPSLPCRRREKECEVA
jgi:hypothetical protein